MAIDKIKQMYTELYNSKYGDLERQKNQGLQNASNQEAQVKNNYAEVLKQYEQNKLETQNKYKTLYTKLDNQQSDAKASYYNQRNEAAVNHAKNTAMARDYLAKNNLLQSGENIDAMLRNNTDYNNNLGTIYTNEQATNRSINDARNQYALDEQAAYNSINNLKGAAEREQVQKLNEILAYRKSLEENFGSQLNSLKSEISANAIRDINAYNEQLRQEAWQKQMEEERRKWEAEQKLIEWNRQVEEQKRQEQWQLANRSYSGGGGGYSSGGYSGSGITADEVKTAMSSLNNDFNAYIKAGDTRNARDILVQGLRAYQNGLMTGQDYNNMQRKLTALEDELLKKQTQAVKNSGGKLVYGYRNGKAGWYPA